MQMYRVKIALSQSGMSTFVEGLVCAANAETAGNTVATILEWPLSKCYFAVERVKPSYYELSRRSSPRDAAGHASDKAEYMSQQAMWWTVSAKMKVRARTENGAVKGAARALEADARSNEPADNIRDLVVTCDQDQAAPRSPALETQAIFSHVRFFQGGAARGK